MTYREDNQMASTIYCIMGKSASGKDSIYKKLVEISTLEPVVRYTTRPSRSGEKNGREYFFVTKEFIDQAEKNGRLVQRDAFETANGLWHYATIFNADRVSSHDQVMIADPTCFAELLKFFGPERIKPIYIDVEDGIRLQRAINRENALSNPNYSEICRRFLSDEKDFACIDRTNTFKNDNLYECVLKIMTTFGIQLKQL